MKLSVIIVSWNVSKEVRDCLSSVYKNKPSCEFEVVVVDNNSSDGTVEVVKKEFPEVQLISNMDNRGFAAANNQAFVKSTGEYVFLLNPDTVVHASAIETLVNYLDTHADVGLCAPKLLDEDGTTQASVRNFPTMSAALHRETILKLFGLCRRSYKEYTMKNFSHDSEADVCQPMGAALMLRRSVLEQVGVMDERFFLYYEEVDLCYRIRQAGWRIAFYPEAVITHFGGRSSRQISAQKRVWMLTSLLKYFEKHRRGFLVRVFGTVFRPLVLLLHIYLLIRESVKYIFAAVCFRQSKRLLSGERVKNNILFLGKYFSASITKC